MGLFNKKDHGGLSDEALDYFQSNNEEILPTERWILVTVVGLLLSIVLGVAYGYISYTLDLHFSLILIGLGYVLATVLKKIAKSGSLRLGVISIVCYVVLVFISLVSVYAIALAEMTGGSVFSFFFDGWVYRMVLENLFSLDSISTIIIYAIGGVATFQYASR